MSPHRMIASTFALALLLTGATATAGELRAPHSYLQKHGANITKGRAKVFAKGVHQGRARLGNTLGIPAENTLAGRFLALVENQVSVQKHKQPHVKRIVLNSNQLIAAGNAFAAYEQRLWDKHKITVPTYFDAMSDMKNRSERAMSNVRWKGKNVRGIHTRLDLGRMVGQELEQAAKQLVKGF